MNLKGRSERIWDQKHQKWLNIVRVAPAGGQFRGLPSMVVESSFTASPHKESVRRRDLPVASACRLRQPSYLRGAQW
jgi:hypothetical protein